MLTHNNNLGDSLRKLFESYPKHMAYCDDEKLQIPTETERAMISEIEKGIPFSQEMIDAVRETLSIHEAYDLVKFAVRTAVFAARTHTPELLHVSALCFMIDSRLDWRDVLVTLSLFEACANDLGVNSENSLQKAAELATPDRRELVVDGFLGRTQVMRSPDVMGYKVSGTGQTLTFAKRMGS